MKKKLLTKALGIFLSAAMVFTSLPSTAFATGLDGVSMVASEQTEVDEEEQSLTEDITEDEAQKISEDEESVSENGTEEKETEDVDIFSLDWKNATDEEFDHILGITDFETTGVWLKSLSEEDFNEALARNTVLNKEMSVATYDVDEDGEMVESNAIDSIIYYEYCLDAATGLTKAQTFKNSSGYYDYKFVMGTQVSQFRMKISGLSTKKETSTQQTATIACVSVYQTNGNFAGFASNAGNYNAGSDGYTTKKLSNGLDGTGNYYNLTAGFGFSKPAGYSVTLTKENAHTGNCSIYYYESGAYTTNKKTFTSDANVDSTVWESLVAYTNLLNNTTVGGSSSGTPTNPVCYTFTFTPSTYYINYNGNGATSGSTASQTCLYGNTYYTPANGYTRAYTVTYNGNGGTPAEASKTANYTFVGWGWETTAGANFSPNQGFYNARTSGTGTFYAIWSPGSVTVPTATRTGYTFKGWSGVGGAGTKYTPTSNVTLTATWEANNIPITYKSDNSTLGSGSVAYDKSLTLADYSNKKTGYTFVNWSCSNGKTFTNKASVKGSDLSTGSGVTMTANWKANNIKVTYKDGSKVIGTQDMTYDKSDKLKTISQLDYNKPGYQISSWTGSNGKTYTDAQEVKNLTTGADIVLTANWTVAKTEVTFKDGDKEIGKQELTYDVAATLTKIADMATKAGYTFKNWLGSNGSIYTDAQEVKNLTTGDPITLTAQWQANTDTKYTVVHMKETGYQTGKYQEAERQALKGTTDTSVTPAVNNYDGYTSPSTQSAVIKGDGSTVITYKYTANKPEPNEPVTPDEPDDPEKPGGLTDDDIKKIIDALNNGLNASLDLKGVTYEIVKNQDGTLSIRLVSDNGQKDINIPSQIDLNGTVYTVSEVQKESFKNNKTIETVKIGDGISKIGASAFEGCTNLKSISFGAGLNTIGDKAFKGCTSLTKITTPSALQTIGASAFEGCTKLATVTLNSGLLTIGNKAFYKCGALKKIRIPDTVLKIGKYAFASCKKLSKVTTSKACLEMGEGTFANDVALKSITLKSKLTKVPKKAFYKCTALKTVKLGANTTDIGANAFEGCKKLTKISIPKKVMTIGNKAFYNCSKLGKVTVKSTSLKKVGSKAFKSCKKGIRFTVPKAKVNSYKKILKGKY